IPARFTQELDLVGVHERHVLLAAGLLVVPGLGALPPFEEDSTLCEAQNYEQQYVASYLRAGNSTKISSA
ncbi:MAG: hypothetical protein WAM71_22530, partial [Candidatus Korobacteraceae bacterium]